MKYSEIPTIGKKEKENLEKKMKEEEEEAYVYSDLLVGTEL